MTISADKDLEQNTSPASGAIIWIPPIFSALAAAGWNSFFLLPWMNNSSHLGVGALVITNILCGACGYYFGRMLSTRMRNGKGIGTGLILGMACGVSVGAINGTFVVPILGTVIGMIIGLPIGLVFGAIVVGLTRLGEMFS